MSWLSAGGAAGPAGRGSDGPLAATEQQARPPHAHLLGELVDGGLIAAATALAMSALSESVSRGACAQDPPRW